MDNILLLLVCLGLGMALRVTGRMPDGAAASINSFVVHISLPAVILLHMHGIDPHRDLVAAAMMPWLLFAVVGGLVLLLGRIAGLSREVIGALILTAGLGNTSFVGLPMIELFFGAKALPVGILIDQLGSYLVLGTVGIWVACFCSNEVMSARAMTMRIVTFPPLIALVLSVALIPVDYPAWMEIMLARLGDTLAPLALVSVGLQLRLSVLRGNMTALSYGLGLKLLVAPAAVALILFPLTAAGGQIWHISVFEAAMGPSIGGAIVAQQYRMNESVVTLMVGIGIPLSLFTSAIWWASLLPS